MRANPPPVRTLSLLVFTAGFATLGVELSASRLLEPAFGNNQIVWAALIGMILLYLALGAWLGGHLADRYPSRPALDITLTLAALGVAAVPLLSRPVLRLAAGGLEQFAPGLLAGALLAVALLFSVPVLLLGTASPWAARLRLLELEGASPAGTRETGAALGRLYALSTAGSLLGAFVPVLFLIPALGTRLTFLLLALVLLLVLTLGAIGQRHLWAPALALLLVAAITIFTAGDRSIRTSWDDGRRGTIIYEDESTFNYIAVREWGSERHLKLNDGIGIHSVYHPQATLSNGIWDYFLLAPLVRPAASGAPVAPRNLLVIGLAAGTVTGLYDTVYSPLGEPVQMTGVELDPQILEVGRDFFAMERPNLTAVAADGRRWLAQQPAAATWDVIAVDAYRPPYIPFHLTTREFFALVESHLSAEGVLAINIGRAGENRALVDALAATVGSVFPTVLLFDEPAPDGALGNTMLVATRAAVTAEDVAARAAALPAATPAEFRSFAQQALAQLRPAPVTALAPFTDDHAPIERVVHSILFDFLAGG